MFMQDAQAFSNAAKVAITFDPLPIDDRIGRAGILASSLVETPAGWRAVGSLMSGSLVYTWDGGLRPIVHMERSYVLPNSAVKLVHVPGGALGACSDLWIMEDQDMLIVSRVVEEVLDVAAVRVRASALIGFQEISVQRLKHAVEMVSVTFEEDEMVYVNSGALICCPSAGISLSTEESFPRLDAIRSRALLDLVANGALTSECSLAAA